METVIAGLEFAGLVRAGTLDAGDVFRSRLANGRIGETFCVCAGHSEYVTFPDGVRHHICDDTLVRRLGNLWDLEPKPKMVEGDDLALWDVVKSDDGMRGVVIVIVECNYSYWLCRGPDGDFRAYFARKYERLGRVSKVEFSGFEAVGEVKP